MGKFCPECYGHYRTGGKSCARCQYRESCIYYTAGESAMDRRHHWVSYEAAKEIIADRAAGSAPSEEKRGSSRESLVSDLGVFFRYLLELDDYTIGLIREIIVPSGGDRKRVNVRSLGELHGCSRQAMHRKILRTIARHPELADLFQGVMEKLSAGRRNFLRSLSSGA